MSNFVTAATIIFLVFITVRFWDLRIISLCKKNRNLSFIAGSQDSWAMGILMTELVKENETLKKKELLDFTDNYLMTLDHDYYVRDFKEIIVNRRGDNELKPENRLEDLYREYRVMINGKSAK